MPAADPDPPRPCHRENRTRKHPGRHRTKSQRPPPVSHSLPPRPNPSTLLPARGDQLPSCVSAPARYGLADRLVGKADLRKNACGRGGRTYQHRTTPVPGQSSSVTRLAVLSRGRTISRARRAHLTNAAGRPGHGQHLGTQMEPLLLLVAAAVVLYAVVGHGADWAQRWPLPLRSQSSAWCCFPEESLPSRMRSALSMPSSTQRSWPTRSQRCTDFASSSSRLWQGRYLA